MLAKHHNKTGNKSLFANKELVYNNVRLAAEIVKAYSEVQTCLFYVIYLSEIVEMVLKGKIDYRILFNNLRDAVFIHDLDGKILNVNFAACSRLGYSRDELQNMRIADIDVPELINYTSSRVNTKFL